MWTHALIGDWELLEHHLFATVRRASRTRLAWRLTGVLGSAFFATACLVPRAQYDQAVQEARLEQTAHADTHSRLYQAEKQLHEHREALSQRREALTENELQLDAAQLRIDQILQERDDAGELAEQLRGELGRIAAHIRALGVEREELTVSRAEAEQRLEELTRVVRTRDRNGKLVHVLTRALHEQVENERLQFEFNGGRVTLKLEMDVLFTDGSLTEPAADVLGAVAAQVNGLEFRVFVSEAPPAADSIRRLTRVAAELEKAGLSSTRVAISGAIPAGQEEEEQPSRQLVIVFEPPPTS